MKKISDVKEYWEKHPLYSYEIKSELGTLDFFKEMDIIKLEDVERFSINYWDFPDFFEGKTLLDIGCGPGFLTRLYAKKGYKVTSIDLTNSAVSLTKKSLDSFSLKGDVIQCDAENLCFKNNLFNYVVSSGVLHHTPDTRKAVMEAYRVLKPGGRAKITLYYKNILLREPFWQFTKLLSRIICNRVPGRGKMKSAESPEHFIRYYDGNENPVGKGYSLLQTKTLLVPPFTWLDCSIHFFPARFMPKWIPMPVALRSFLDRKIGTMIFVNLIKPEWYKIV